MKFRALVVAMMAGGLLAGCALQDVGAPIYSRTGSTGIGTTGAVSVTGDTYTVQPGDTLYSIATRNGCNPTELAQANGITDPTLLAPGTVLRLTSARTQPVNDLAVDAPMPSTSEVTIGGQTTTAQPVGDSVTLTGTAPTATGSQKLLGNTRLSWPVARGQILRQFSDENSKGIEIAGNMGDDVRAAAAGRVLYTGENVSGYGKLIIITHGPGAVTVYGHNSELLVKRGDNVTNGQVIAKMGNSDSDSVNLLFEVRHNDRPVNPVEYLPQ
ncbi:peptidoglycan DD-metalloendopeptidase family protein [Parasutterella secunda]|uniref:peptidoglycan DD-metalloendopeptidase family protein n=1 Tax=Parasutterella secunda TaxID=626947 RepID=UPI0025A4C56C|nr:peptidoglycan DD-metalloendopeptidase family protein [Parasutterella secunda]MDM8088244.1 peptidoglycan DD-metalloendopeptidase family protein [Parasutterella secunda]